MPIPSTIQLADGVVVPKLFFSTPQLHFDGGKPLTEAIAQALQVGFRGINTYLSVAREVGEGIREWGGKREDLYIAISWEASDDPKEHILKVLSKMKIDFIDDFQLEYRDPSDVPISQTWKIFEEIQREGLARSISIRDFPVGALEALSKEWKIKPNHHQVEHHPYCSHLPLLTRSREMADRLHIPTGGYSTLVSLHTFMNGPIDIVVNDIAAQKGLTDAQVVLLWVMQTASGPISASTPDPKAMREYLEVFEVDELDEEELEKIRQAGKQVEYKRF